MLRRAYCLDFMYHSWLPFVWETKKCLCELKKNSSSSLVHALPSSNMSSASTLVFVVLVHYWSQWLLSIV